MADLDTGAPRSIGRYIIEAEAGRGGMGVVYRGHDPELGRAVAIKAFRPGRGATLAALRAEARLLAALHHPGIADIHDILEAEGGHYLVLEFVEGESLTERLARGPLPVDDALHVCADVARAIEAAHLHGVIHRDLKPANVMLTPGGACRVVDFGLGRLLPRAESRGETTVMHAPISGTPAYMSPEQMRGAIDDARTDVWAFGCLACECLTAQPAAIRLPAGRRSPAGERPSCGHAVRRPRPDRAVPASRPRGTAAEHGPRAGTGCLAVALGDVERGLRLIAAATRLRSRGAVIPP